MDEGQFDFSVRELPQAWLDASQEAPKGDGRPLSSKLRKSKKSLVSERRIDLFGALVGALAISVVTVAAWYGAETGDVWVSPWAPVLVGLVIGVGVRLGAGKPEPSQRASIAVFFYLMAAIAALYLIQRHRALAFLDEAGLDIVEQRIIRGYLRDLANVSGLLLGGIAAAGVNLVTKLRR